MASPPQSLYTFLAVAMSVLLLASAVNASQLCELEVKLSSNKSCIERHEGAKLVISVRNLGAEVCSNITLSPSVKPALASVALEKSVLDVPRESIATVIGNFTASLDGSYYVTIEATRGATMANGTIPIIRHQNCLGDVPPVPTPTSTTRHVFSPIPSPRQPDFELFPALAALAGAALLYRRK